ncbi:ABC transporter family substrate-binding protein [Corynebacterium bovis]|uniref:ABC transporter family substrate-binding protein n=1 Tax=Corynebacterium bovis TaxID=36808 RepID=UPI002446CCFB|nr:ABC transporter family substrate-binding protein [Corynebacterium bovis]MDH2456102.1 ABC transporter family substrate-binding protein [Corynebacterium bovis]
MTKTTMRAGVAAAVSVLALTLASCGSDSSGGSGAAPVQIKFDGDYNEKAWEDVRQGGTLTLAINEIAEQQNPDHGDATAYTSTLAGWYLPQVTLMDGKGTVRANPDYLTGMKDEVKDGKTVVTYDIRPEAAFNDGTPIDWQAFETTWKALNGKNPDYIVSASDGFEAIESVVRGENDKQVVVTYNREFPWWFNQFSSVLHPALRDPEVFNKGFLSKLPDQWGAGPYKVGTADFQGGTVTFVPNEKWWGPKGRLDTVTFRQMESQASLNAFKAGEIDATGVADKERLAAARQMGDKVEIRTSMRTANVLLTLNSKAPLLKDVQVRKGIMTGIDRSQMAAIQFNGLDYTEKLPGSFVLFQFQDGYKDIFGDLVSFNSDEARKILDDAGWTVGGDGVREKDGQKLSLKYVLVGDDQGSKALATALQKMLKDIGVDLQVQSRPSSDFAKILETKDFDVFASAFNSGSPDAVAYFGQVYASDSTLNNSGTGTPELDRKIAELQKLPTAKEQIEKSHELEKEGLSMYGIMPWANGPAMSAVKPGLANIGPAAFASVAKENIGWEK